MGLVVSEVIAAAAAAPELAFAGFGPGLTAVPWSALPWSALPWREGAMIGLPLAGTAAGRIARRGRRA